jgi:hypothetical protein
LAAVQPLPSQVYMTFATSQQRSPYLSSNKAGQDANQGRISSLGFSLVLSLAFYIYMLKFNEQYSTFQLDLRAKLVR